MTPQRGNLILTVAGLLLLVGGWACTFGNEGFFSIGNLEVVPQVAEPGEGVAFVFNLTVVPARSFTVIASIGDGEHSRQTYRQVQEGPFVYQVGDAADLIGQYGVGEHIANIQVRLNDSGDVLNARSAIFVLQNVQ